MSYGDAKDADALAMSRYRMPAREPEFVGTLAELDRDLAWGTWTLTGSDRVVLYRADDPISDPAPEDEPPTSGSDNLAKLLHGTTDASTWAHEFVLIHGGDEGLMIGWFANAIETGRMAERQGNIG
jgi:hypothetical protein